MCLKSLVKKNLSLKSLVKKNLSLKSLDKNQKHSCFRPLFLRWD